MTINRRFPGTVGRGSISIITVLLAIPKLLLLPSLTGAFFAPIGVLSSAARSSSAFASPPGGGGLKNPSLDRYLGEPKGIFAAAPTSAGGEEGGDENDMPPPEAGVGEGASGASGATRRLSPSASAAGAMGTADGASGTGAVVVGEGDPVLVNVANGNAGRRGAPSVTLWNVPNILTMARVVAIPVFVAMFYAVLPRRNVWCAVIFAGAAFTDWLDGYIARRMGIVTPFGSFLDPVADKLLVSTALILLSQRLGPWMTICSAVILCRELGISALREWMAQLGLRETVKVGNAGKWKTATQMIAISMLLLLEPGAMVTLVNPATFMPVAKVLMYVSTVLTVTSGSGYLSAAWPTLMGTDAKQKADD